MSCLSFSCQIFIMALFNPLLVKKLEEIFRKNPANKSFCSLAQIYYSQSDFEKAEKVCLEGLVHNPFYSQAYVILGNIYKNRGEVNRALAVLNKAREHNPENPNIYRSLAELYVKKKDMEKTLNAYKMLNLLKPEDKTARMAVRHLEKVLCKDLIQPEEKSPESISSDSSISRISSSKFHRLKKLQLLLAKVENHINKGL